MITDQMLHDLLDNARENKPDCIHTGKDIYEANVKCIEKAAIMHVIDVSVEWKGQTAHRYERYCTKHSVAHQIRLGLPLRVYDIATGRRLTAIEDQLGG